MEIYVCYDYYDYDRGYIVKELFSTKIHADIWVARGGPFSGRYYSVMTVDENLPVLSPAQ